MDLKQAESLALTLMTKHGLIKHGFNFKWNNKKSVFGSMNGSKRLIILSSCLVALNPEERVKDTILHEIAHALDYIRNGFKYRVSKNGNIIAHDVHWKNICIEIGCNNKRCYDSTNTVVPVKTWKLVHTGTGTTLREYRNKHSKYINSLFKVNGVLSGCHWEKK